MATFSTALRFADLGNLPRRMLAPIGGYENVPVVSLEKAVQPLVDIMPQISHNVSVVKANCTDPEDGLTSNESASIMLYTLESSPHEHSLYFNLNAALHSEQREKLQPWSLYLRLVLTALTRLPSKHCLVNREVRKDVQTQYPIGESITWWGFSSCHSSSRVHECENYVDGTETRTLFQIKCYSGKDIKNHSFPRQEDEILLLPGRQMVVISSVDSGDGLRTIKLEEIESIYPLLRPVSLPTPTPQPKKSPSGPSGAQGSISSKNSKFLFNLSGQYRLKP